MRQPEAVVDHVVVAAATLDEGVAWCERVLGITPGPGGKHPLMSTHNRLFNISSEGFPKVFFEIIAIDPDAPPPSRARWFGLDSLDLSHGPRLVNVVARTNDVDGHRAALLAAGAQPGDPVRASRATPAGVLQWSILVAADGALDGALPTLIQWDDEGLQPATRMPPSGVQLQRLSLHGLSSATASALNLRHVSCSAGPVEIELELLTPRGIVALRSTTESRAP